MIALLVIGWLFMFWPLLLLLLIPRMGVGAGVLFMTVQLVSWWATFVGWFLLIYPCAKQRWVVDAESIADSLEPRAAKISRWAWRWMNPVWGNPHEGVSGQEALVRNESGTQIPYMPAARPGWRAYCWSAWRNSADGLKYLLEWEGGPLVTFMVLGRQVRAGWLPMPQIKGAPHVPVLG